ncbi:MAG: putative toxin-antitoxin system toxin component, PIN family [Defluviitaleaceae bacterium]|nr:putative toxin-antitoxin system toxin component, PIN family [Defluviitaleaceae bacterium]
MRVMLDTNILVSAFVFRSKKIYAVIDYIVANHELVLPSYVVDELKNVVECKFPKMTNELDVFLTTLSFTLAYTPNQLPTGMFEIRDISDAPILYTAIIEGVDVLITGDKDFDDVDVDMPDIVTIASFETDYMEGENKK